MEKNTGKLWALTRITSSRLPQCSRCIHHLGKGNCKAFPDKEIPHAYRFGKVKHFLSLGNQVGDYIYVVKEEFKEEDERYKLIGDEAIVEFEINKKRLPKIIIEKIKEVGGDVNSIDKLILKASGPLSNRFDLEIEFFPKEKVMNFDLRSLGRVVSPIIKALEAKNLEPKFKLTIFKNGDYKYE